MTKDQEYYVQIYDLGREALESYEPATQLEEAEELLDYIEAADVREFAEEIVEGMRTLVNDETEGELLAALESQEDAYTRVQRPDRSVHVEESELGFAKAVLQIYGLYEDGDILFSEAGKAIMDLAKMAEERGYDSDLSSQMELLGSALKIEWSRQMKEPLHNIREYVRKHDPMADKAKPADEYHKVLLRDLVNIISEFTYIVIRKARGTYTLETPPAVYEDIIDTEQIKEEYLWSQVLSIKPVYDEEEEETYLEIWIY